MELFMILRASRKICAFFLATNFFLNMNLFSSEPAEIALKFFIIQKREIVAKIINYFQVHPSHGSWDFKVHIFWEGHKILRNLHRRFDWHYIGQIYVGDFAKFCGLLRIYEFYKNEPLDEPLTNSKQIQLTFAK